MNQGVPWEQRVAARQALESLSSRGTEPAKSYSTMLLRVFDDGANAVPNLITIANNPAGLPLDRQLAVLVLAILAGMVDSP